jgi:hypothetical protein
MFSSKDLFFAPTATTGYTISRSLRFRSSASAYLSRTPASAGSRTAWTLSLWAKVSAFATNRVLLNVGGLSTGYGLIFLNNADQIDFQELGGSTARLTTTRVFRDPSAFYHFVFVWDSSNATAADRMRIYVNGVRETAFGTNTNPSSGAQSVINTAALHRIGWDTSSTSGWTEDGYLAEVNFIDGQALTPSSFGETDATTGVWKPKACTVSDYGKNGFYLPFSDATSTTTIGYDKAAIATNHSSANNWTPNNISVTAGTTYDSMIDTPTPYDDGGNGVGNYATLNPLSTTAGTYSSANLRYVGAAAWRRSNATISISSGKWYFEVTVGNAPYTPRASNTAYNAFGFGLATVFNDTTAASSITNAVIFGDNGYYKNFSNAWTDSTYSVANGDVLAVAVDLDANTFTFYQNNTSRVTGTIGTTAGTLLVPIIQSYDGSYGVMDANFGQRPFTYTPPSGFKALNTQNLPTPTIANGAQYMAATTYTGTGSAMSVANTVNSVSFQPDLIWVKQRNNAATHVLADAVRGVSRYIFSNLTNVEATATAGTGITAFSADGFTLGTETSTSGSVNAAGGTGTYVAWQWKANGSGSSNTSGSITSTVSANATAGFSVVIYTGTLTGAPGTCPTVGHGLGVAPSLVISKSRNVTGVDSGAWFVWSANTGSTDNYLRLNTTAAVASVTGGGGGPMVAPTSTVFSTPYISGANINANNYVAYCFAAVAGYSAFGSYTGNGSADGPFVFTGFRPKFVLVKRTDSTSNWFIHDTARDTYNVSSANLYAELSNAEDTGPAGNMDFLSNGFKSRTGGGSNPNVSGGTYIYAAFAEVPFKYALGR